MSAASISAEAVASLDRVARAMVQRKHAVAATGAGVSVDSGIPDFRSPGGLWDRFDPMEFATIHALQRDPRRVWQMLVELEQMVVEARPNLGHQGLARLEQAGVLDGIITQNIDNLHQQAGSRRVVEFHGNGNTLRCLDCQRQEPAARRPELGLPPTCDCGGVFKPDVVFFGEMIPQAALDQATALAQSCEVMLVVGTSATVAPASMLPMLAKRNGALLMEFNLEPTEITAQCDETVHAGASVSLPLLAERVEALLASSKIRSSYRTRCAVGPCTGRGCGRSSR